MNGMLDYFTPFNCQEYTILIIDDNPTNIELLLDQLESYGFEVMVARDGESGLKRAQYARPDLILLDLVMPQVSGFEKTLRSYAEARVEIAAKLGHDLLYLSPNPVPGEAYFYDPLDELGSHFELKETGDPVERLRSALKAPGNEMAALEREVADQVSRAVAVAVENLEEVPA